MKRHHHLVVALAASFALSACASTTKVTPVQPGDNALTCDQIKQEFAKMDGVVAEAEKNQGINARNVATVFLFWPAMVGTWLSADEAKELVDRRRAHLMAIYNGKRCA